MWKQHKFWRIRKTNQVWMKKTNLYSRPVINGVGGVRCNMARVTDDSDSDEPWYFDSGCSTHMTGNAEYLEEVSKVKGGKVTFGDGGYGIIKGKGTTCNSDLPKLVNVYFIKGLKANLISVSQLCTTRKHAKFRRRFRRTTMSSDVCDGLPTNFRRKPIEVVGISSAISDGISTKHGSSEFSDDFSTTFR